MRCEVAGIWKFPDGALVIVKVGGSHVVMATPLGPQKSFGITGCRKKLLSHGKRHDVVRRPMRNQDRHLDVVNLVQRVKALRHQKRNREETPFRFLDHRRNVGKRSLKDQAGRIGPLHREMGCNGPPERMSKDESPRPWRQFRKSLVGCKCVFLGGALRGGRLVCRHAAAKSPIVDGQHREAHPIPTRNARDTAGQVPARAVQVKKGRRSRVIGWRPPGMNLVTLVSHGNPDFLHAFR